MLDGPSEIASWVFPHEPEDGMKPSAQQKHPRADATCRIVPITDSAYQIAVAIPDMMTSFATEDAAQAGIAEHEWQVESGSIVLTRTEPTKAGKPIAGVPAELEIYRAANILLKEYGPEEAGLMTANGALVAGRYPVPRPDTEIRSGQPHSRRVRGAPGTIA